MDTLSSGIINSPFAESVATMNPFRKTSVALKALIRSRSMIRRRSHRRNWMAESLEPRTLLTMPAYALQTGVDNPMDGLATGPEYGNSHPTLVDLDGDLDLDLVIGRANGISYFENTGNTSVPVFTERTAASNPFSSLDAVLFGQTPAAPALADWDADGDLDLLWATFAGLTAYENTGTANAASFAPLGPGNPFDGLFTDFAISPVPAFADMDGDLDYDLVVSKFDLRMRYYENIGSPTSPSYNLVGPGDPFAPVSLGFDGSPALGDTDGDGDVDLVVASFFADVVANPVQVKFFENTGNASAAHLTAVSEVFDGQFSIYVSRTAPALGDLDGDGDQDLLLAVDGELLPSGLGGTLFRYYEAIENPVVFKPQNSVPLFQLAKEDIAVVFSVANGNAISVADPNADGSDLQVTLSTDQGQLTLATTAGLNFAFSDSEGTGTGDGINDATLTFRGTLEEINAALDGLTFLPAVDFSGDATVTITTNDLGQPGGGAALSDTDAVPITVLSVATQVEQLQLEINLLVEFSGLNQGAANVLLHLLNLSGRPAADAARIRVFMVVVRVFGRVGILTEGSDQFLLERAQDILTGITTRV